MLMEELEEQLQEIMPNCKLRKDRNGQIVIHSGLIDDGMGELVPIDEDEDIELPEDDDVVPLEDEDDEED